MNDQHNGPGYHLSLAKDDYNHPGRRAYANDGIAGWVRWQQGQA